MECCQSTIEMQRTQFGTQSFNRAACLNGNVDPFDFAGTSLKHLHKANCKRQGVLIVAETNEANCEELQWPAGCQTPGLV